MHGVKVVGCGCVGGELSVGVLSQALCAMSDN